jgi:hypothetical protein
MIKEIDWTIPDKDGIINIPDKLDPLFDRLGMQLRFHTISGKSEVQTIVDMTAIAQKFFMKNPELLKTGIEEEVNPGSDDRKTLNKTLRKIEQLINFC